MAVGGGDIMFSGLTITAIVTVALWVCSRIYEWADNRRTTERERTRYLKALYAEVDFNTKDMEIFVEETNIEEVGRQLERKRKLVPHITDARHTQIYKNEIHLIHHVGGEYLKSVVYFYGLLEKIRSQIEGVQQPSYRSISPQGRAAAVRRIYRTCEQCAYQGLMLLREMEECYPELTLKRKSRHIVSAGLPSSTLKLRMEALEADIASARKSASL